MKPPLPNDLFLVTVVPGNHIGGQLVFLYIKNFPGPKFTTSGYQIESHLLQLGE